MFKRLTQNLRDMGTIKTLCEAAERIARANHQERPGAEHFVLAALELPDGSAGRIFGRLGLDGADFARALQETHEAALSVAGVGADQIEGSERDVPPLAEPKGLYAAAPSGAAVLQGLAALRKHGVSGPLSGAHVLEVVSTMQHGTTARAFRLLGRDPASVAAAVRAEVALAA